MNSAPSQPSSGRHAAPRQTSSPVAAGAAAPTAWDRLGLAEPLINAPMAGAAGAELADAVRTSGGLGLVAVGHGAAPEFIAAQVGGEAAQAERNPGPGSWGVGLMAWSLALDGSALDQVLEYTPPVVALSAGDPTEHARRAHAAGSLVAVQVGTPAEIRAADENPDIDLVVARGAEAGGHGLDAVATLPLLQLALDTARTPVAAAGGIATARGVAAVLGAGAVAAWIGTRFIPCAESLSAPALQRAVTRAGSEDTVYTSVFDLALGTPWPVEYGGRALRNVVTASHAGSAEAAFKQALVEKDPEALAVAETVRHAKSLGDPDHAPVYAGQAAGLLRPEDLGRPAAEVMAELAGFREVLAAAVGRLAF